MSYSIADKTIKLWKVSERDRRAEGYNLKEDSGVLRDPSSINTLRVRFVSSLGGRKSVMKSSKLPCFLIWEETEQKVKIESVEKSGEYGLSSVFILRSIYVFAVCSGNSRDSSE